MRCKHIGMGIGKWDAGGWVLVLCFGVRVGVEGRGFVHMELGFGPF